MKELLALAIDRGTSALVSQINQEIGRIARYQYRCRPRNDGAAYDAYADKLQDYIQLKLRLHHVRKSMYYPFDAYAEKEDVQRLLDQAATLRQEIKQARANAGALIWGDLEPTPSEQGERGRPIHCSWTQYECNDIAARWYRGNPFCLTHFEGERWRIKQERRDLQREREEQHRAAREREIADWQEKQRILKLPPAQYSHTGYSDSSKDIQTYCELPHGKALKRDWYFSK
jgi:hypothetical protein